MKLHRFRLLSASAALAAAPFAVPALITQAYAAGPIVAEAAVPDSVYGLAARLPKDTEGFVSFYRLSELWNGFRKSNFVKKVLANEQLVKEMKLDDLLGEWERNPVLQQYGTMAGSMLGGEVSIILPAGFSDNFSVILKNLPALQSAFFVARQFNPGDSPGMPAELLPLVEAVAGMELPPVTFASWNIAFWFETASARTASSRWARSCCTSPERRLRWIWASAFSRCSRSRRRLSSSRPRTRSLPQPPSSNGPE